MNVLRNLRHDGPPSHSTTRTREAETPAGAPRRRRALRRLRSLDRPVEGEIPLARLHPLSRLHLEGKPLVQRRLWNTREVGRKLLEGLGLGGNLGEPLGQFRELGGHNLVKNVYVRLSLYGVMRCVPFGRSR